MTMGVVVVVLVGDRAVGIDVGLVVGLDDVEPSLVGRARWRSVWQNSLEVSMSSSMWGSMCTR